LTSDDVGATVLLPSARTVHPKSSVHLLPAAGFF